MTLGERILLKRKEAGMSQENLGDKLDVSRQTVYKWENDQATPELDKLIAMAKIFNVKVGWLIAEEESEQSNIAYDQILYLPNFCLLHIFYLHLKYYYHCNIFRLLFHHRKFVYLFH